LAQRAAKKDRRGFRRISAIDTKPVILAIDAHPSTVFSGYFPMPPRHGLSDDDENGARRQERKLRRRPAGPQESL
jgi:hypothetical protein